MYWVSLLNERKMKCITTGKLEICSQNYRITFAHLHIGHSRYPKHLLILLLLFDASELASTASCDARPLCLSYLSGCIFMRIRYHNIINNACRCQCMHQTEKISHFGHQTSSPYLIWVAPIRKSTHIGQGRDWYNIGISSLFVEPHPLHSNEAQVCRKFDSVMFTTAFIISKLATHLARNGLWRQIRESDLYAIHQI